MFPFISSSLMDLEKFSKNFRAQILENIKTISTITLPLEVKQKIHSIEKFIAQNYILCLCVHL